VVAQLKAHHALPRSREAAPYRGQKVRRSEAIREVAEDGQADVVNNAAGVAESRTERFEAFRWRGLSGIDGILCRLPSDL
jgi:hypothetical protein